MKSPLFCRWFTSKFKVGDLVICNDNVCGCVDEPAIIDHFRRDDGCPMVRFVRKDFEPKKTGPTGPNYPMWNGEMEVQDLIDNPINRKLYPDYKEWQGYLLPAKFAAKLTEGE